MAISPSCLPRMALTGIDVNTGEVAFTAQVEGDLLNDDEGLLPPFLPPPTTVPVAGDLRFAIAIWTKIPGEGLEAASEAVETVSVRATDGSDPSSVTVTGVDPGIAGPSPNHLVLLAGDSDITALRVGNETWVETYGIDLESGETVSTESEVYPVLAAGEGVVGLPRAGMFSRPQDRRDQESATPQLPLWVAGASVCRDAAPNGSCGADHAREVGWLACNQALYFVSTLSDSAKSTDARTCET